MLDNLIDNARRHARTGGAGRGAARGSRVRLLVEDDGPGIPQADRERVFDRFTRLDPAREPGRRHPGSAWPWSRRW